MKYYKLYSDSSTLSELIFYDTHKTKKKKIVSNVIVRLSQSFIID